jgi:agmatinase
MDFLDLESGPIHPNEARYTLMLAPYDGTSTYLKGSDRGPEALIAASANLELYDIPTGSEAWKSGIATYRPTLNFSNPETMTESVRIETTRLMDLGTMPIIIGGEHSVSPGAVWAAAERHPGLTVLQLDAHSDLRNEYKGSRFNHACAMARITEVCPVVQVGIRSMDAGELETMNTDRVFFAHEIYNRTDWQTNVLELLGDEVWITIDLDVFDPSLMPSTGTPEPGGLDWYAVDSLVRNVAAVKNLIGFDVVELLPGSNPAPDFTAAKLVYGIISAHNTRERALEERR